MFRYRPRPPTRLCVCARACECFGGAPPILHNRCCCRDRGRAARSSMRHTRIAMPALCATCSKHRARAAGPPRAHAWLCTLKQLCRPIHAPRQVRPGASTGPRQGNWRGEKKKKKKRDYDVKVLLSLRSLPNTGHPQACQNCVCDRAAPAAQELQPFILGLMTPWQKEMYLKFGKVWGLSLTEACHQGELCVSFMQLHIHPSDVTHTCNSSTHVFPHRAAPC